jgi:hypothetical protein
LQLFEDNPTYLSEDYKAMTVMDVDYAIENRDITGLENIYTEVKKELRRAMMPEIKDKTKEGMKEAAQVFAQSKEPPLPDGDPDDSEIGDKDEKDLELF